MDLFGLHARDHAREILERNQRPDADYLALKGDWEKIVGPQMDVPRRGPSWSTKPDTENPTKVHPKYTGICSAHRDGEDPTCRICYPDV